MSQQAKILNISPNNLELNTHMVEGESQLSQMSCEMQVCTLNNCRKTQLSIQAINEVGMLLSEVTSNFTEAHPVHETIHSDLNSVLLGVPSYFSFLEICTECCFI